MVVISSWLFFQDNKAEVISVFMGWVLCTNQMLANDIYNYICTNETSNQRVPQCVATMMSAAISLTARTHGVSLAFVGSRPPTISPDTVRV